VFFGKLVPVTKGRLFILAPLALALSGLYAERIPDPTRRAGADPLFQIRRGDKWGYIDRTGKVVIVPKFDSERDFFHGRAGVQVGKKWGFIDSGASVVIPLQFDEVRDFLDDLAPVRIGRKWGYVDAGGRMVIAPSFQAAAEFHEGLARVHLWDSVVCSGDQYTSENAPEWAFRLIEDNLFDMPECFPQDGHFGFIDKTGAFVIAARFFIADNFSEGLAAVRVEESPDSKYGYIDRTGTPVINPRFNQAGPFSEGRAAVETSARTVGNHVVDIAWGFIDKSGQPVIPAKYQFAGRFSEGLARIAVPAPNGWAMGYINRDGRIVVSPQYDQALDFSEGLAAVFRDSWHYINQTGKVVNGLSGMWPFSGGLSVKGKYNHQNYIDQRGKVVAPYETQ
jgi:hypothetical protein